MVAAIVLWALGVIAVASAARITEGHYGKPCWFSIWTAALLWPAIAALLVPYMTIVEAKVWRTEGQLFAPLGPFSRGDA